MMGATPGAGPMDEKSSQMGNSCATVLTDGARQARFPTTRKLRPGLYITV